MREAMVSTQHIDTARKFLKDADREYEAGDVMQASEKLWGAAAHIVTAEMKRRGMGARSHRALVQAVEKFADDEKDPSIRDMFGIARSFHSNFYNGTMEDYEFEVDRPAVHRFVDRILEMSNGSES